MDDYEGVDVSNPTVRCEGLIHPSHDLLPECTDALEQGDAWVVQCACGRQENVCGACLQAGRIDRCSACKAEA